MHTGRVRRKPIVEMNLIPLIDVSLILVIIFMVLTPVIVQHQMTVRLPSSTEGAAVAGETAVEVRIDKKGRIAVDGKPVKFAKLEKKLQLLMGKASRKTLLIEADKTVPIEKVVVILDIAKRLGVGKLGIAVTPQDADR